ncbi:methyltransferase domain-containing protein [Melittangium boletus]|uniref:SAM-dependent methyltransferase n=1 Tax=Melittangium boletus DSM 14713 TaxID=1294270 RepID=A0A250ISD6_9BACT|nr:methyltransferase domain-containing protein [Melittangium boletus]ATB34152.1 SAM-dependent methyltransferase [Melittangium boletus DSM 14713]
MGDVKGAVDREKVKGFAERVISDVGASMHGALSYLGDRLGIFKAMAGAGPMTARELAEKTKLSERYLLEWLNAMVAARYVDYQRDGAKYHLPPEHAAVLANEESPAFMGGFLQVTVPVVSMAPRIGEAFRDAKGVSYADYNPEMAEVFERISAPQFKHKLVPHWIPAMPHVYEKLQAGGRVLDVGCGSGVAALTLARAFPKSQVAGIDYHQGSIDRANANAKAEGLSDRVTFSVENGTGLPADSFDLITSFAVVHDSVDPLGLMTAARKALSPTGSYLLVEDNVSSHVEENINPLGRAVYSLSTLYCITVSMAYGGAALGGAMGEGKTRELAEKAGFGSCQRLVVDDPFVALFELRR